MCAPLQSVVTLRRFSLSLLCVLLLLRLPLYFILFHWLTSVLAYSHVYFVLFSLSARLSRSPVTEYTVYRVGFCYNFLSRVLLLGHFSSRHITLVRKKPFRYLIVHINTHNFIYVCRTFVCLCVKLSRNAALIPHIYFSLFFHSVPLTLFASYHLTLFYLDKLFAVRTFCICSIFKPILFFFLSFRFAHSSNLNLVLDLSPLTVSLSLFILWLKHFLSQ